MVKATFTVQSYIDEFTLRSTMYAQGKLQVPCSLLSEVESQFTNEQRNLRSKLFHRIMNEKSLSAIILKRSQKQSQKKTGDCNRGSRYIGVSLNSHGYWQIMFKYHSERYYLCSLQDLEQAAVVYDIAMIQIKGMVAKTNFDYNKMQLLAILLESSLIHLCKQSRKQNL